MTIALPYNFTYVNELDDVRLSNLKEQPFARITSYNVCYTKLLREYDFMDEYRYQVFTDYIDMKTQSADFKPFRLEFVKIIPHRNPHSGD